MKLTTGHFRAFADAIQTANATVRERRAAAIIIARVAESMNPKFDRSRFFKAAGVLASVTYTARRKEVAR